MASSILVVDDVSLNRVIIGRQLRALGLDVIEAANGREGLQAYLRYGGTVACIFLDLMMPVLDGFAAALSIRSEERRQGWLPVPIVAYTSEDVTRGSPMHARCMASGFNDVVPKPMSWRNTSQLLTRLVPGISVAERPAGGATSSDDEAACSCDTSAALPAGPRARCTKCSLPRDGSFASAATAAAAAARGSRPLAAAPSRSSGSGGGGGSDGGGGDGSSASSARQLPPQP